MTARTRCGWAKSRECSELLYGINLLKLKGAVYISYVRIAIVHGSEGKCNGNFTKDRDIYGKIDVRITTQR